MSLANIFQKPKNVIAFGNVYPVKLKDWEEFESNINPIILGKKHIQLNIEKDVPLFDRIILLAESNENILEAMCTVFNIVSRTDSFRFVIGDDTYGFINAHNQIVNSINYELIRDTILNQNILFEPKIYKNPAVAKWATKVLEARGKNAPKITLEDKISTVSVMSGKHYWDLAEYTIYQLNYDFNRILKIKDYESQSLVLGNPYVDMSKVKINHFAESINLYENPYDTAFKDKGKLNKLNMAIQGG